jgi:hypothetical protein
MVKEGKRVCNFCYLGQGIRHACHAGIYSYGLPVMLSLWMSLGSRDSEMHRNRPTLRQKICRFS